MAKVTTELEYQQLSYFLALLALTKESLGACLCFVLVSAVMFSIRRSACLPVLDLPSRSLPFALAVASSLTCSKPAFGLLVN